MVNVIEKSIIPNNPDTSLCEDGLYLDNNFIAVVDGVTSKGNLKWDNQTSGCYAKNVIIDSIKNLNKSATKDEAITYINMKLHLAYGNRLRVAQQKREA